MSIAATNTAAFYDEVQQDGAVWTIRDEGGFPAPLNAEGKRSQPFWSKASRAAKVVSNVPAYQGFSLHRVTLSEFLDRWLPGLGRDGLLVGLNWAGDRATGYDFEPAVVRERFGSK